jgi:hypothetical protein
MKPLFLLILAFMASPNAEAVKTAKHARATKAPPSAAASKKGESGIKVTLADPKAPHTLALDPQNSKSSKAEAAAKAAALSTPHFELSTAGPGKLTLRFVPAKPGWELDSRTHMVIQLRGPEGMTIQPSLITRQEWPKTGDALTLTYKGKAITAADAPQGGASFTACDHETKQCERLRTPVEFRGEFKARLKR